MNPTQPIQPLKPMRKPITSVIYSAANTLITVAATASELAGAAHDVVIIGRTHLKYAKINAEVEAELDSIANLAEILNLDEATLKAQQQVVIDKYKNRQIQR